MVDSRGVHRARLELNEPRLKLMLRAAPVRVAAFVHSVATLDTIDTYVARLVGGAQGRMRFEQVEV